MSEVIAGVVYPAIRPRDIQSYIVPVAPLAEQERIVAEIEKQLTRLDAAVAALERVRVNLKRYRASVLKAAVEGRLVPTEGPPWPTVALGSVLNRIQAGRSFRCEERTPQPDEIGVVKVSAVTWGEYDEDESKMCIESDRVNAALFVNQGDFLFSRANTIQLVGACVIANRVTKPVMLSDKILRFTFTNGVLPKWVLYFLRSQAGRLEIERYSTGNQESMRNIGQDRIRLIALPIPSLPEQELIVAEVDSLWSVIDSLETTVDNALKRGERLRQAVLKRAFEGRLVPQDPDDEPASVLLERIRAERARSAPAVKVRRARRPAVQLSLTEAQL
jgi:type I restriction enzyme S subunit